MTFCLVYNIVSTHSRPKAAGKHHYPGFTRVQGFNTQPPEGGWLVALSACGGQSVSTHSRPKAAGLRRWHRICRFFVSTHSRPKAAGYKTWSSERTAWFQHTAARRRLGCFLSRLLIQSPFQHTAARRRLGTNRLIPSNGVARFNTQPPEGGWLCS